MAGFSPYGGAKNMRARTATMQKDVGFGGGDQAQGNPFQGGKKMARGGSKGSARVKARRMAMMKSGGARGAFGKRQPARGFGSSMGFGGNPIAAPVAAGATTSPIVPAPTSAAMPSSTAVPPINPANQRVVS